MTDPESACPNCLRVGFLHALKHQGYAECRLCGHVFTWHVDDDEDDYPWSNTYSWLDDDDAAMAEGTAEGGRG